MNPENSLPSPVPGLRYAWYGDDFTGASDTLATLAEAGLRTRLFLDVPSPAQLRDAGPLDAVGIAGAARAMTPRQMRAALAPVARFFSECGAPVLHYKCCSTFDSAPHVGSIGEAVRLLAAQLNNRPAFIVGGQPSLGRYCVFGQLFATASGGDDAYRIDRHPTMSCHPVTPMMEADLIHHLGQQGLSRITLIDVRKYAQPGSSLSETALALDGALQHESPQAVLLDVLDEAHIARIGTLIGQSARHAPQLCVGASSVAQAMLDYWQLPRHRVPANIGPANGPVLVFAGSMSPLTAAQITHAVSYQRIALDAARLRDGDTSYIEASVDRIARVLEQGLHVLAHTSPVAGAGAERCRAEVQEGGNAAIAIASAGLLRQVLERVPVVRLGVAGGDTSSFILKTLAPTSLEWIGRLAPGIALCRAQSKLPWLDSMEIMLKGGQMGGIDLFELLIIGTKAWCGRTRLSSNETSSGQTVAGVG